MLYSDVDAVYKNLLKDARKRTEIVLKDGELNTKTYNNRSGYSEAILKKKWFRYPEDNVRLRDLKKDCNAFGQSTCFENAFEQYLIFESAGLEPRFFDCRVGKDRTGHSFVDYMKNGKRQINDAFYLGKGQIRYDKKHRWIYVGKKDKQSIRNLKERDFKDVVAQTEELRKQDGIFKMLECGQNLNRSLINGKIINNILKYDKNKKELEYNIIIDENALMFRISAKCSLKRKNKGLLFRDFCFEYGVKNKKWAEYSGSEIFRIKIKPENDANFKGIFTEAFEYGSKATEEIKVTKGDGLTNLIIGILYCKHPKHEDTKLIHSLEEIRDYVKDVDKRKIVVEKLDKMIRYENRKKDKLRGNLCSRDNEKNRLKIRDLTKVINIMKSNAKSVRKRYDLESSLCKIFKNKLGSGIGHNYNDFRVVDRIMCKVFKNDIFSEVLANPYRSLSESRQEEAEKIARKMNLNLKMLVEIVFLDVVDNIDSYMYVPEKAGQYMRKVI